MSKYGVDYEKSINFMKCLKELFTELENQEKRLNNIILEVNKLPYYEGVRELHDNLTDIYNYVYKDLNNIYNFRYEFKNYIEEISTGDESLANKGLNIETK